MMIRIAVIGSSGFVGSHVCKAICKIENVELNKITRRDNLDEKISKSDMIIHCANSPKRFKASIKPDFDYEESVLKTFEIIKLCKKYNAKLTLISSISARTQENTTYGRNRRVCEMLAEMNSSLIIRLGYMFSYNKVYGALNDLANGNKVYLNENSEYSYSDIEWNSSKIVELSLSHTDGLFEIGAQGSITLRGIAELLGSESKFENDREPDIQIANSMFNDTPEIGDFISYLKKIKQELV